MKVQPAGHTINIIYRKHPANWRQLISFHPQIVFLPNLSVNLCAGLRGIVNYASAQALDFLDLGQKPSFLDWKHQKVPFFSNGLLWAGTN